MVNYTERADKGETQILSAAERPRTAAPLAVRMEIGYSKKEILALYASNAPFGSNVVGLDAASWRYFGRAPDKLSWGEMAALAANGVTRLVVGPASTEESEQKDQISAFAARLALG